MGFMPVVKLHGLLITGIILRLLQLYVEVDAEERNDDVNKSKRLEFKDPP